MGRVHRWYLHMTFCPTFRPRGFTLVETLIALLVLSIGLLGIAALYLEALQFGRSAQYRDREMGLANAVVPVEEQPALDDRELIDEATRASQRVALTVGVGVEVGELAVRVTARDARLLQQRFETALVPALAAGDPRNTVDLNRFPSGVVADRTRHERW